MDFFAPSMEEIKKATSGGSNPEFAHGEEVIFMIKEVAQKNRQDGQSMMIVNTTVMNTAHQGAEFKHFINSNEVGMRIWLSMLACWWTPEQIAAKQVQPNMLVGRQMTSTAKINAKGFLNFFDFKAAASGPQVGAPQVAPQAMPQATATPQIQPVNDLPF